MLPWAHPTPNPKQHLDQFSRFFAQLTAKSRYTLQRAAPSPPVKIAHSYGGSEPPSNTWFLWPTRAQNPNSISIGSAVFVQHSSPHSVPTYFTMSCPPPHNCPFPWGSGPPSNTWFLGPTSLQPKRQLDRFSRFCRAHYCDKPTDHATRCVTIGLIYICYLCTQYGDAA